MKHLLLSIMLCVMVLGTQASASVASDIRAGLSFKTAIVKGIRSGESVEQVIREALRVAPRQKAAVLAAAFSISPKLVDRVVRIAIGMGISAGDVVKLAVRVSPKSAKVAVAAAISAAPTKTSQILSGAVSGGASAEVIAPVISRKMSELAVGGSELPQVLRENPVFDEMVEADDAPVVPDSIVIPPSRGGDADVVSFN